MRRYLALAGVSGSGKTFLRERLVEDYPDVFYNVEQYTTRAMRAGESPDTYNFVDEIEFRSIARELVGVINFNGQLYGSRLRNDEEAHNKIGIIILSKDGILDFQDKVNDDPDIDYFVLGLDKDLDSLEIFREGRNEKFVAKEREFLPECDIIFNLKKGYADADEIAGTAKVILKFDEYDI